MIAIRSVCCAASLLAVVFLSACASIEADQSALTTGAITPSDERPQDEPVALGKLHYGKGDYGLAERHFRAAVEANPLSSEAWLGLAASYDRLRRFDLADRAYKKVLDQQGRTPAVLNNLGYHHMLRGNLKQARVLLIEAAQKDPSNSLVQGNLLLLETWKSGDGAPPEDRG